MVGGLKAGDAFFFPPFGFLSPLACAPSNSRVPGISEIEQALVECKALSKPLLALHLLMSHWPKQVIDSRDGEVDFTLKGRTCNQFEF